MRPSATRILHTEASRGWGGQEIRILTEIAAMRCRGHELWLACAPDSELAKRAKLPDVPIVHLPFAYNGDIDTVSGLHSLVRKHRIQIVNTHSSIDSWCAAIASLALPKTILVRTRHLSNPIRGNFPTQWLYRRPHAIVTTGEALRQQVIGQAGTRPFRTISIPTGIDPERFDPALHDRMGLRHELNIGKHEILIGTIAMLRGWKGHRFLIQAAPEILAKNPLVRFIFIGDTTTASSAADDLRQETRKLGIEDRFLFAGYRQDIPAALAAIDLIVLPSTKNEGVPQSLSQALCMAKPVVATSVGSVGELVIDQRTGRLVPPSNSTALAEAVNSLLADPGCAARWAQQGRDRVLHHYSITEMVSKTERLYHRLLLGLPGWPDVLPPIADQT